MKSCVELYRYKSDLKGLRDGDDFILNDKYYFAKKVRKYRGWVEVDTASDGKDTGTITDDVDKKIIIVVR